MADPIFDLMTKVNKDILDMNAKLAKGMQDQMAMMAKFAPHNMLPAMTLGGGEFSATKTTTWLDNHLIM